MSTASGRPPRPPRSQPLLVLGLVGFTGFMCMVPVLLQQRHKRLTQGVSLTNSERPLTHAEVRRGAYLNTGSRDVGPDPDWNWKDGTYKGVAPSIIDESTGLSPAGSRSMRAATPKAS